MFLFICQSYDGGRSIKIRFQKFLYKGNILKIHLGQGWKCLDEDSVLLLSSLGWTIWAVGSTLWVILFQNGNSFLLLYSFQASQCHLWVYRPRSLSVISVLFIPSWKCFWKLNSIKNCGFPVNLSKLLRQTKTIPTNHMHTNLWDKPLLYFQLLLK